MNRNLVAWIDSHYTGAKPVVRENRGDTLVVASLVYDAVKKTNTVELETIPATFKAARNFLGY